MRSEPASDLEAVAEVRRVLGSLLSNFERGTPDAAAIEVALGEVSASLSAWGERRGRRSLDELDAEVVEGLETCRRLHAVALTLLAERRVELAQERSLVQRARRHLAELGAVGGSGGSCDVAG